MTSREFAQTVGLLDRFGIEHMVVGAHGGASRRGKARAMAGRSASLARVARAGRFDLAVAHGSTDQPLAARLAGTPQVTMFDYEFAAAMHHWNGRLATRVLVPAAIPEAALARYGMRPPRLRALPRPEGGVLPRRPRLRRGRGRGARARPGARHRRRAPAARGHPLPPGREHRPVRRGAGAAAGGPRRPDRRAPAHRRAAPGARRRPRDRAGAAGRRARAWWPRPTWSSAPGGP